MQRNERTGSLKRGPLVYGVAIDGEWRKLRGEAPAVDYEIHPVRPWNLAVKIDASNLRLQRRAVDAAPFSPDHCPLKVSAHVWLAGGWKIEKNTAADPATLDAVREESAEPIEVSLLPYGATLLRVTEAPLISQAIDGSRR